MGRDEQGLLVLTDDSHKTTRPKSLIHAISEIEQFSVAEMHSEIPEGSLPLATALSFYEVGFKHGFISGLITAVMTPFMMLANENLIPVFGEFDKSLFDRLFSIALTITYPIAFALFLYMTLTKSYAGNITRRAINNLVGGVSTGAIAKTILMFFLYHFISIRFLEPDKISALLNKIRTTWLIDRLNINYGKVFDLLMGVREILIPSAYYLLIVNFIFVSIVVYAVIVGRNKTSRIKLFKQEWE